MLTVVAKVATARLVSKVTRAQVLCELLSPRDIPRFLLFLPLRLLCLFSWVTLFCR